jgi:hypothetical protein
MDNYSILLTSRISLKSPPKKNKNNEKSLKNSISHLENETNIKIIQNNTQKSQKRLLFTHKKKRKNKISINDKTQMNENNMNKSISNSALPLNVEIDIKEYLVTSMDDLDYDELINRENRSFWRIFLDKLIVNQKLIDLFYNNN